MSCCKDKLQDHCKKPCTINLAQRRIKKDRNKSKVKVQHKFLLNRQLQGLIKQYEQTVVTFFRLADTSIHQAFQKDHDCSTTIDGSDVVWSFYFKKRKITEELKKMCYILNIVANYRSSRLLYLLWSAHYLLLWLNKLAFFFFFF